jgi:hypothetical protein
MSHHLAPLDTLKKATDAVVEYALISLEPEFLCWEKDVNMEVAELIWNADGLGINAAGFYSQGGDLSRLARALCEARRTRWPDEDVWLINLDVHIEDDEITFTFDLSWDEGETLQPCKIAVEDGYGTPEQRN